jgi:hypothetical protein
MPFKPRVIGERRLISGYDCRTAVWARLGFYLVPNKAVPTRTQVAPSITAVS